MAKPVTFKVGRDAETGHFIKVSQARNKPATSVVETIKRPASSETKKRK